jgi:predicted negative regulator of RcsB-dependent stress response
MEGQELLGESKNWWERDLGGLVRELILGIERFGDLGWRMWRPFYRRGIKSTDIGVGIGIGVGVRGFVAIESG